MPFDFDTLNADAQWVEDNLKRTGGLVTGSVTRIDQRKARMVEGDEGETVTASMFEVDIDYSVDASGPCPKSALLKIGKPEFRDLGGSKSEVLFYRYALEKSMPIPIPACYGYELDESRCGSALLLERITGDFETVLWRADDRVGAATLKRMVTSMADLHAAFWGESVPHEYERFPYSREKVDFLIKQFDFYNLVEAFLARAAPVLGPRERSAFESFVSVYLDRLKDWLDECRTQTVIHGDPHVWNFLVPKEIAHAPILLDWATWDVDVANYDLAYAIVLRSTLEIVIDHGDDLISAWRTRLAQRGVDYPDEDFWYDYRHSVVRQLVMTIMLAEVTKVSQAAWQETIPPVMAALDKYDCWPLLQ